MSEKEYGTFGPAVDAATFFTDPIYYQDGVDMISQTEYSRHVSELMDRLGYSYEMIKQRQRTYPECDELRNRHNRLAFTKVTTGSKGEGTTLFYESDIDTMFTVKDVICAENPHHFIHQENITLFQTEAQETPPGYIRLRLLRFDGKCYEEQIRSSLLNAKTGPKYLSSEFFLDAINTYNRKAFLGDELTTEPTSGPSSAASTEYVNFDNVSCFRCFCPSIIKCWVARPRSRGWPSPQTVHEISRLDGHAVPVGFKESHDMYREWRICYSLAELQLMRNLNEAQLKVYILLKKISKSALKTVCKDMTSYIMKNTILWMCERNGTERFTQELILDRLYDCIQYLKKCVCDNNLPSYMIPDRNLLAGRLVNPQKQQLTGVLNDLLQERGRMILRCDKLREAMIMMYKTPGVLKERHEKRDKVESLVLKMTKLRAETWRPEMSTNQIYELLCQNEQYCDMSRLVDDLMHCGRSPEDLYDLLR